MAKEMTEYMVNMIIVVFFGTALLPLIAVQIAALVNNDSLSASERAIYGIIGIVVDIGFVLGILRLAKLKK